LSFSNLYNDILNRKEKISLVGLGYVGMPIAVSFSRKVDVIGFDVNHAKIDLYKSGVDPTKEVGDETLAACTVDHNIQRNSKADDHLYCKDYKTDLLL
jgi:UDP-N-acetyl-D-galactosamine dehydrogenase